MPLASSPFHHRAFLLDAVRVLREQGAVWVYLLQQQQQQQQQQQNDVTNFDDGISAGSSGIASANSSCIPWNDQDHDFTSGENSSSSSSSRPRSGTGSKGGGRPRSSPGSSRSSSDSPAPQLHLGSVSGGHHRCLVELTPEHQNRLGSTSSTKVKRVYQQTDISEFFVTWRSRLDSKSQWCGSKKDWFLQFLAAATSHLVNSVFSSKKNWTRKESAYQHLHSPPR